MINVIVVIFAMAFFSCASSSPPAGPPRPAPSSPENRPVFTTGSMPATGTVRTRYGNLTGVYNEDRSVRAFAGVPFAQPPLGDLRFRVPQPPQPWSGILACDRFPNAPMQDIRRTGGPMGDIDVYEDVSEDCLYLNIWTGAESDRERRPVIVYMYPGGFTMGSASSATYDGEAMAKMGVVFVTVNSRLGVFGFLPHPDLSAESEHNISGNYGLFDQLAALRWVKENITAFGGDPNRVTIAGHSAGSKSVNYFAVSPLAEGLFQRGIASSSFSFGVPGDNAGGVNQTRYLADMEQQAKAYFDNLELSIEDLRRMPAEELLSIGRGASRMCRPVVDGYLIPDKVHNLFAEGRQHDVQLIIGSTADEAGPLFATAMREMEFRQFDPARIQANTERLYGNMASEFSRLYPSRTPEEALHSRVYALTDNQYTWHVREWAELDGQSGNQRIYAYNFSRIPEDSPPEVTEMLAFHCSDIVYFYRNLHSSRMQVYNDIDRKLSETISSYIVNFAATGNPNGAGLPVWEPYMQNRQFMELGTEVRMIPAPRPEFLDFWGRFEEKLRGDENM